MTVSIRRMGIAFGALVEGALVLWLLGGFLPAGPFAVVVAIVLGALIYRDITRREIPDA